MSFIESLNRLPPEPSHEAVTRLIASLLDSSHSRFQSLQPKDSVSSQPKFLLKSETRLWSLMMILIEKKDRPMPFNEEKSFFFKAFNAKINQIWVEKDLSALLEMKHLYPSISQSFVSELDLISDIISYDDTLNTLYSLTNSLPDHFLGPKPIFNPREDFVSLANLTEHDLMGSFQVEDQGTLVSATDLLIRNGVEDAQEFLLSRNRHVLAAILNAERRAPISRFYLK